MFSRFTLYFDEVVRSGSIRRASEKLGISPSAIDRHILLMEENMGVRLFERIPQGLRLTAAGDVLIANVRRWRQELALARMQIDDLRELRGGEVTLATVEGLSGFLSETLAEFRSKYPGIAHRVHVVGGKAVLDHVLEGRAEVGLGCNPPPIRAISVESTLAYQLGAVMPADHELACKDVVTLADCVDHGLIVPDDSMTLRAAFDSVWARAMDGNVRWAFTASSVGLIKGLIAKGAGVGILTPIDVAAEVTAGEMVFRSLAEPDVPLSVFSLITAAGRTLSAPASLLVQHLAEKMQHQAMSGENAPADPGKLLVAQPVCDDV